MNSYLHKLTRRQKIGDGGGDDIMASVSDPNIYLKRAKQQRILKEKQRRHEHDHGKNPTMQHTPRGRGYDESLHYFHHMNDYWMQFYVGNVGPAGGINGGSAAVRCGPNVSTYPSNLPAPVDLCPAF